MSVTTSEISKVIHGSAFRPVLVWFLSLLGTMALAAILSVLDITPAWSAPPDAANVTVSLHDLGK